MTTTDNVTTKSGFALSRREKFLSRREIFLLRREKIFLRLYIFLSHPQVAGKRVPVIVSTRLLVVVTL